MIKTNFKDFNKKLKKLQQNVQKGALEGVHTMIDTTTAEAKNEAGSITMSIGRDIAGSITSVKDQNGGSIIVDHPKAAYFEFGTGQYVFKHPDYAVVQGSDYSHIQEYAWTFKGEKAGTITHHPYLYPAFFKNRDQFVDHIKKVLEDSFK